MAGFSLTEVLVALVIGLIGIVVMMQVFSMNEGQRRTATGADDAIGSGSVTLFGIQRDIQRSGWGVSSPQLVGCAVSGLAAGGVSIPLAPVIINPAGITADQDPNTDSLMIISGGGNGSVEGASIEAIAGTQITVHAAGAFRDSDSVVLAPRLRAAGCSLTRDSVTSVVSPVVNLAVGPAGTSATIAQKDILFNLGGSLASTTAPSVRVYRVRNQTLTVCDFVANNCSATAAKDNPAVWVPLANNVVSLRAQYGRDASAPMDGVMDVWDRTVPVPAANPLSPPNFAQGCAWARVSAVRLALVARSNQPEKLAEGGAHVTPAALTWAGSDELAVSLDATEAAAVAISLPNPNATWPTWQDFRYKMFQTIIPLRNISTQGVPPEC